MKNKNNGCSLEDRKLKLLHRSLCIKDKRHSNDIWWDSVDSDIQTPPLMFKSVVYCKHHNESSDKHSL